MYLYRATPYFLSLAAVVLLVLTVVGSRGLLHLHRIDGELEALEAKNRSIQSDIARSRAEISSVEHNPFTLEKRAREELGLAKPDEIIYFFPQTKKDGEFAADN